MRPRLALSIGAAFNILAGLVLVLAPAQLLSASGWPTTPNEMLVPARDAGTLLIVLGIIDWVTRGVVGAPLRGLLWANIVRPAAFAGRQWLGVGLWDLSGKLMRRYGRGCRGQLRKGVTARMPPDPMRR